MKIQLPVTRFTRTGALLTLVGLTQMGGCDRTPCPDPEPFVSGDYEIMGLAHGEPRLSDQWLLDTLTGARLSVDREAGEATIQYSKAGTTYQVHYTIEQL